MWKLLWKWNMSSEAQFFFCILRRRKLFTFLLVEQCFMWPNFNLKVNAIAIHGFHMELKRTWKWNCQFKWNIFGILRATYHSKDMDFINNHRKHSRYVLRRYKRLNLPSRRKCMGLPPTPTLISISPLTAPLLINDVHMRTNLLFELGNISFAAAHFAVCHCWSFIQSNQQKSGLIIYTSQQKLFRTGDLFETD